MDDNHLILTSSISSALKRSVLFKGSIFAGIGAGILLFAGSFMPAAVLNSWGFIILIFSGVLITFGLLPYRQLVRAELNPNELIIVENKSVLFTIRGKQMMSLPLHSIEKYSFIQRGNTYGIGIWLKQPLMHKLIVHDSKFDIIEFQSKSQRNFGCDLFFPYFTKRSYKLFVELKKSISD